MGSILLSLWEPLSIRLPRLAPSALHRNDTGWTATRVRGHFPRTRTTLGPFDPSCFFPCRCNSVHSLLAQPVTHFTNAAQVHGHIRLHSNAPLSACISDDFVPKGGIHTSVSRTRRGRRTWDTTVVFQLSTWCVSPQAIRRHPCVSWK